MQQFQSSEPSVGGHMVSPVPMGLPAVILGGWSGDEGSIPGASLQASLTQSSQCPCEESVYHHPPNIGAETSSGREGLSAPISPDFPIPQASFRTLTLSPELAEGVSYPGLCTYL